MQVRVTEKSEEFGNCGCGRSPSGKCIGWHALSEEDYQKALKEYKEFDEKVVMKELIPVLGIRQALLSCASYPAQPSC